MTVGGITWKAIRPWSANDVLTSVLAVEQPAPRSSRSTGTTTSTSSSPRTATLATTGQATRANLAARILFTMGCHGGLNVADTLPAGTRRSRRTSTSTGRSSTRRTRRRCTSRTPASATATAPRSRSRSGCSRSSRKNLHSDTGSVGEQWVERSAAVLRNGRRVRRLRREGDGGDDLLRAAVLALRHGAGTQPRPLALQPLDDDRRPTRGHRHPERDGQLPGHGRHDADRSSASTGRSCRSRASR